MQMTIITKHYKKLSLLLGILSTFALPPYYAFPLLFLTFSTLITLLDQAKTKKQSFAIGYWFGFGFFSIGLSWVGNALLIDAAKFGWLYIITIIASGAFFGLFTGFPTLLTHFFKNTLARTLALASFISIFEWIRSWILTGFPWNLWGSTLAFSIETIQLASIIGAYGLSFLVILLTCCPALFIKKYKKTAIVLSISIIAIITIFGIYRTNKLDNDELSNTTIRVVQPSIPQAMKWSANEIRGNFNQHIRMSQQEGLEDVDFVIWGETATPFTLDMDKAALEQITMAIPKKGYLVTGLVRYEFDENGNYQPLNSMFIIDKKGNIIDYYDKTHLVPFGEYIPLRKYLPNWVRPVANTIANFKKGEGHKVFSLGNHPTFGALICYEIIFPHEVLEQRQKPQWIINITNDGWYGDSAGPRQHLVATQLRATEEGITIVRVANSGISAILSTTGKILKSIPLNQSDIIDAKLPKKLSTPTLYSIFGNALPLLMCLIGLIIALFVSTKNKN